MLVCRKAPWRGERVNPARKRNPILLSCSFLLLLAAILALTACDAYTSAHGTVSDSLGRPVPDASVRLTALKTGHTRETKSDQDGSFRAEIVHGWVTGRFQLIVSKQGYSTYQQEVQPKTSSNFNVVLMPGQK